MTRWLFVSMTAALLLSACSSGQTGSADCNPAQACECKVLQYKHLAMVTVLELNGPTVVLRVEEVLNPDDTLGMSDIHVTLTGNHDSTYHGCAARTVRVKAGDSALAVMSLDAVVSDAGQRRLELYSADLFPWSDPVQLAGGDSVALDELAGLTRDESCHVRFPRPQVTCNDSQVGCALVTPKASTAHAGAWLVLVGMLVTLWRTARRRRQ